ncbi:MAG: universal stress protein [Vicinamibacterales bacterium]
MAILCGTDLSARGAGAAGVAAAWAARAGGPLVLVHALEVGVAEAARASLDDEVIRLRDAFPGLAIDARLEYGLPDEVLARLSAPDGAAGGPVALVVVASLGRRLPRWLLGSVAERTAQSAPVPVLVVRDPAPLRAWLAGEAPLRVLAAFDFGDAAEAALAWVASLTRLANCHVDVVHLAGPGPAPARGRRAAVTPGTRLLADVQASLARHDWGAPPPEPRIVPAARRTGVATGGAGGRGPADLIVLGTRRARRRPVPAVGARPRRPRAGRRQCGLRSGPGDTGCGPRWRPDATPEPPG